MEILPNIKIIGLALFLEKQRILAIGDTHIGLEEALNKEGILIPRLQFKETIKHLDEIFKKAKPDTIILLGDIKHEFGTISRQEWRDTLNLLDYLLARAKKVILIKGNHDTILGPLAEKKDVEIKDHYLIGEILFCHGHKLLDEKSAEWKKARTIIIGHEHPAISLRDGPRVEKYKCFLFGKYKPGRLKQGKSLIVVPSFNFVIEGSDVLQEKLLSPFINNIYNFEAFIAGDKVYKFGKISRISKIK